MKKIFSAGVAAIAVLFCLTGCADPVMNKIRSEVKLEDASIYGVINSLVRYQYSGTEYLYFENGAIYYKAAASTASKEWTKDSNAPISVAYYYYDGQFSGTQFIKIAADEKYVYALGITYTPDGDEGENVVSTKAIYYTSGIGNDWDTCWTGSSSSAVTIFCTNSPVASHRSAYARINSSVYQLSGSTDPTTTTAITANGADAATCSAVYSVASSTVRFFDAWASASDESAGNTANHIYYASDGTVYYSSDGGSSWSSVTPGSTIISMAVNKDSLIIGTNGSGLYRLPLTDGVPSGSYGSFSTNADSVLSTPYRILMLFALNPALNETANTLYASANYSGTESSSSGTADYIGLWSYYETRGNWNRE